MPTDDRRAAVDRWYRAHADAVRRYAVRRVDRAQADEIVSEVFAAALTTSAQPPDGEALPWLYGIARNVVATVRHRNTRAMALVDRVQSMAVPTAEPGPADRVVSAQWVTSVFDQLDDGDAELLRLVVWEGLPTAAAAEVLRIRPGTARVRLHRLRRRIQRQLSRVPAAAGAERSDHGQ